MPDTEDVIILCGGVGLRLRAVTADIPKSLASVAGRPFLEVLLRQVRRHELRRVILATGYRADAIRSHFGDSFDGLELVYSEELSPLGTGGALRYAARQVGSATCLVMNGDSYTDVDLGKVLAAHGSSNAQVSLVVVPADERSDSGSVGVDGAGNVRQFLEKEESRSRRFANAGIYVLARQTLFEIPTDAEISLERELFPEWIRKGLCVRAFVHSGKCIDIGTPGRYQLAQAALANVEVAAGADSEGTRP